MSNQQASKKLSEEERIKQMAAQMRAAEYKGLSEEEIRERERQKEMRKKKNIEILENTLSILEKGRYEKAGQNIKLNFSKEQMQTAQVFLPNDIETLKTENDLSPDVNTQIPNTCCYFNCENEDALVLARKKYQNLKRSGEKSPEILVLNLASATQPGGHTKKGADAQEEDLCRRTSLLLSLESDSAEKYYNYNNAQKTCMGSDGIVLSPYVDVIKDSFLETLDEPFPISVISCAAPMVRLGLEGMSQQEYENMLYKRIWGIFSVAASQNYRHLILGAFGCGVYGNDAAVVSDLFAHVVRDFSYFGKSCDQLFDSVDFAVLCRPGKDYNYKEFFRNFSSGTKQAN